MGSKKDIRQKFLIKRNCITKKDWEEKSHRIFKKVVTHPFFMSADTLYCYLDYRNEVATRSIIEHAWNKKKKVAVPKIVNGKMAFYFLHSFDELITGTYGISEPKTDFPASETDALVIMPGAVFDKKRNRIGYGKGYYDKYLYRYPNHRTMALAFEFQITDTISSDIHDVKPEIIITEDNIYV